MRFLFSAHFYLGLVLVLMGSFVQADQSPHQLVEGVATDMLRVIKENEALVEEDPEAFYNAVEVVLLPVVAFDYIAKGVMGRYAKEATPEQRERFSEAFQSDLITTYAKGMVAFSSSKIEVIEPPQAIEGQKRVSVMQKVYTDEGEHTVAYTMGKSKRTNEWKLLNVVINGVNLGSTFRSQFSQAMQREGDLEKVIANWSAQG